MKKKENKKLNLQKNYVRSNISLDALALIDSLTCFKRSVKTPNAFASNACCVSTCKQKCNVSRMRSYI